jgi:hypothetical protein
MPGGLIQLVAVGAQNELVNGNPSMTHFRAVYRRHTNFAMESIRMTFTSSNLQFDQNTVRKISCRIDRYAQLLLDTYLIITLPDIWSPLSYLGTNATPPAGYDQRSNSLGYEFQWIKNIGYNLIDHIEITANGQVLQTMTGEWMKMYSYLTHDANKRKIIDQMVGNVPELYDPANGNGRQNQYPHAITPGAYPGTGPNTTVPEPSIRSRQLNIPLHFWFCENPGLALPLVAMQNSDVFINVYYRPLVDLFTVIDTSPTSNTYGQRIPLPTGIGPFLSPPNTDGYPTNPQLSTFFPDPYLEGNFVYLTEMEMSQIAGADQTFLVKTIRYLSNTGQYGSSDSLLPAFNLVTRLVFSAQRTDKILNNDWDNYTNWDNPRSAPFNSLNTDTFSPVNSSTQSQTFLYSSGQKQITSVSPRDPVIDGVILLDGKERFTVKPASYFSLIQMYKHTTGEAPNLPGVYQYSFALNNDLYQPSGALNASMFNKTILRLTLQQPVPTAMGVASQRVENVLKSSLFGPNPVIIPQAQCPLFTPDQLVTVVVNTNGDNVIFSYTYNVGVYVESINFLRITSGLANFVFAN